MHTGIVSAPGPIRQSWPSLVAGPGQVSDDAGQDAVGGWWSVRNLIDKDISLTLPQERNKTIEGLRRYQLTRINMAWNDDRNEGGFRSGMLISEGID